MPVQIQPDRARHMLAQLQAVLNGENGDFTNRLRVAEVAGMLAFYIEDAKEQQ